MVTCFMCSWRPYPYCRNAGAVNSAACIFNSVACVDRCALRLKLCLNSLNSDAPSPLTVTCVTGLPAASVTTQVRSVVNLVGGQVKALGEDDVVVICGVITYLTLSEAGGVGVDVLVTCVKTLVSIL